MQQNIYYGDTYTYNKNVDAYNHNREIYNDMVAKYNTNVNTYNSARQSFVDAYSALSLTNRFQFRRKITVYQDVSREARRLCRRERSLDASANFGNRTTRKAPFSTAKEISAGGIKK